MITLFTFPNGGYQVVNPTPESLDTPAGATRSDHANQAELAAAIAAIQQPQQPDWKGFASWARDNVALNTAIAAALPLKPVAAGGIGATLLQASQGDLDNFASYFEAVCSAALVTSQQRGAWADLARDTYHLPADFVAVVRAS